MIYKDFIQGHKFFLLFLFCIPFDLYLHHSYLISICGSRKIA